MSTGPRSVLLVHLIEKSCCGHDQMDLLCLHMTLISVPFLRLQGQAEAIGLEFPQHAHKVHLLSEMIGRHYDIRDPYGGPLYEYRQCANEIERLIEEGYPRIMQLVG